MRKLVLTTILIALAAITFAQVDGFKQQGNASFYADKFEGRTTASGERYSHKKATCAHLSLPFGTLLKVTNLKNGKTAVVRVNDRGPFVSDRIIDLSKSVAERLDFVVAGITEVKIEVINSEGEVDAIAQNKQPASSSKSDDIATQPSKVDKNSSTAANKPLSSVESTTKPTTETDKPDDTELFRVDVSKVEPKGYTVQIASYKELVSVLRIAADVEKALNEKIRVQVTSLKGERIYRIMVGNFSDVKDARKFRDKASKIYNDCFVVNLNPVDNTKVNR